MGRTYFRLSVILNEEEWIRHQFSPRLKHSRKRRGRTLKIALQGLPLPDHRIPETPSLVILKMATQDRLELATLRAMATTSLQAGTRDRLHLIIQDLPYQLKNLFGQTIPLKIVVPNTRIRLVTLVGTILLGPTPRVATGLTRGSTVGTPRAGTGSTSTSSTGQEWAVLQDKDIHHLTLQHSVHQGMKDTEEVHQGLLDTIITPEVHHLLGVDNMTRTLVHQRLEMTCTTEDGVVVDIHLDRDIHKEDHQQHHQELLHHPTIPQPPSLLINIRKVEMGHNQGVPLDRVLRGPQVGCRRRAQG